METKGNLNRKSDKMKQALMVLFILICGCIEARTVIVEVHNVRGDQGNILVMAQQGKDSKPVYGSAKPENGKAVIRLENIEWEKFDLSAFHDENGNWQMDMTEEKRPIEGYAMKSYETEEDEVIVKLRMYYPVSE